MTMGATFVGPDVAEMRHAATIAISGEVNAARLAHAIGPSPPAARSGCDCSPGKSSRHVPGRSSCWVKSRDAPPRLRNLSPRTIPKLRH